MTFARKMAVSLIVAALLLALVVHMVGARETAKAAWEVGLPAFFTVGAGIAARRPQVTLE